MIQKELSYFIDEEMLQKVLAFAQVFNLKITRWEKSKTALKINFFNGNLPVGEFNLNTTKCPEDINGFNTYTFNFFTSFGQIKGTYIIAMIALIIILKDSIIIQLIIIKPLAL